MLEEIKQKIINGVDPSWPIINKIRYVYLELGKEITKDADFFIYAQKKFDDENKKLSFDDLKDIYENENGRTVNDKIAVICRSSCYILKDILKSLGIQSKVLKTKFRKLNIYDSKNYKSLDVFHYILEAKDKDDYYLMALSADLPYIHNNMKTQHFAADIPFSYQKNDGSFNKIYDDGEDNHTIISEDRLRDIDEEIGYLQYYYNYNHHGNKMKGYQLQYDDNSLHILKIMQRNNNLYYNILLKDTDFYKDLYTYTIRDNKEIFLETNPITDLDLKIKDMWVRQLCHTVTKKIEKLTRKKVDYSVFKLNNWSFRNWQKAMCENYKEFILDEKDFSDNEIDENFKYNNWSRKVKECIEYDYYDYDSILAILDKTSALINLVYGKTKGRFNDLFNKLGFHFINKKFVYDKNNVSSTYVNKKFATLFPFVFSANDVISKFNQDSYAEQSALIKEIIEMLFPELDIGKNGQIPNVFKRIQLFTVQNNDTQNYDIVFKVASDKDFNEQYYLYKIKENEFFPINILSIMGSGKYTSISERLRTDLTDIDKGKKR